MAIQLSLIAMQFYLSINKATEGWGEKQFGDLIPVDGFVGEDWRKPTHLAIKIGGETWLIPMSDLEEEVVLSEEDGEPATIWLEYLGSDQRLLHAIDDDSKALLDGEGCYYLKKHVMEKSPRDGIKIQRL